MVSIPCFLKKTKSKTAELKIESRDTTICALAVRKEKKKGKRTKQTKVHKAKIRVSI